MRGLSGREKLLAEFLEIIVNLRKLCIKNNLLNRIIFGRYFLKFLKTKYIAN